jgi:hypothetical protein
MLLQPPKEVLAYLLLCTHFPRYSSWGDKRASPYGIVHVAYYYEVHLVLLYSLTFAHA